MDTLKAVLGNEPGTKAKALLPDSFNGPIWNFIEQHKDRYGDLYWTSYQEDKGDPTRLDDWDFSVIEFYYDVNAPIWMAA